MNHIIAKTQFNITLPKEMNGYDFQQALSRLFWKDMVAAIEALLNQYAPVSDTLVIEKLDLDLGQIQASQWESAFKEQLLRQLKEALQNTLAKVQRGNTGSISTEKGSDTLMSLVPNQQRLFDIWLYFLKTGTLPPSVSASFDETIWQKAIAETLTLNATSEQQFLDCLNIPPSVLEPNQMQGTALERLILQFDESFLAQLASILTRSSLERLPELRLSLLKFFEKSGFLFSESIPLHFKIPVFKQAMKKMSLNYSKHNFWVLIFKKIVQQNGHKISVEQCSLLPFKTFFEKNEALTHKEAWILFFQNSLSSNQKKPKLEISDKRIATARPNSIGTSEWDKACTEILEKIKSTKIQENNTQYFSMSSKGNRQRLNSSESSVSEANKGSQSENPKSKVTKLGDKDLTLKTLQESIEKRNELDLKNVFGTLPKSKNLIQELNYIQNAGVVLTHAFLPLIFKELKWLDDKKQFKNESARHRAIHLIHYLASGQEGLPEYRLLLPKLLCGLRLDLPIERGIILKKKEKAEADSLLKSLIKHWSVLGDASIQALREGFFNRDGKLSTTDKGPLLQIEQRTEDILLSRLPWSIGMIKLPWMKEMLFVEWA